jgi:hypothetical protein
MKCTISPHKNTMKSTKKTSNAHKRSSKASFIIHKMLLQILVARFTMREWQREGKEWEKFWHNRLALRIDGEMRRGRHSFIVEREERPLLDELQVSHIKGKEVISRGRTFRVLVVARV